MSPVRILVSALGLAAFLAVHVDWRRREVRAARRQLQLWRAAHFLGTKEWQ